MIIREPQVSETKQQIQGLTGVLEKVSGQESGRRIPKSSLQQPTMQAG